jgi:hypothetical protein
MRYDGILDFINYFNSLVVIAICMDTPGTPINEAAMGQQAYAS